MTSNDCTCTAINSAFEGNKHGHDVACPCWGTDVPNRVMEQGLATQMKAEDIKSAVEEALDEKNRFVQPSARELSKRIDEGSIFTHRRDPIDPAWDIVTMRVPNARIRFGPEAKAADEITMDGARARLRQHRYILANAEALLRNALNGAMPPEVLVGLCEMIRAVTHETLVQEKMLDTRTREETLDVNDALQRAKDESEASTEAPTPGKIILLR